MGEAKNLSSVNPQILENAKRALVVRNFTLAETISASVLRSEPRNLQAILIQGICAMETGRPQQAIPIFRNALELSPNDYVAMQRLPIVLRKTGRYQEALELAETAHRLWPDDPRMLNNLGLCFLTEHRVELAISSFRKAIKINPRISSFHHNLGTALQLVTEDALAARAYQEAIVLAPKSEESRSALILLLLSHGNTIEALAACRGAIEEIPTSANCHLLLSGILRELLEKEEAEEHIRIALNLDTGKLSTAAVWMNEEGRFDEAKTLFDQALERNPSDITALAGLAQGKRISEADRGIVDRIGIVLEGGHAGPAAQASLHYALGKAYDDLEQFETAMKHFDEANRIQYDINLAGRGFQLEKHRNHLDQIIATFSQEFLARDRNVGNESELPIFIVGMIRSGTTLTEQMISSHPRVGAAGEQRYWMSEAPRALDLVGKTVDEELLRDLGATYLQIVRRHAPEMPRITDKMPLNYIWAGLIRIAFPNARIIHVRRAPIANCLSIYMTALPKAPDFGYDKANIVAGYREYQRIMEHWRKVLPSEGFYEFDYEDLVADPEAILRNVIAFCGLEWDDACLHHERNVRSVTTPSVWQVRQPVYKTSLERWRNYQPWLGAFAELLPNE